MKTSTRIAQLTKQAPLWDDLVALSALASIGMITLYLATIG